MLSAAILAASLLTATADQPVRVRASAYCPCARCCGLHSPEVGGHGLTTSGRRPTPGITIAAPRGVPRGTVLCIEGLGVVRVDDRGGAIRGRRVDIFVHVDEEPPPYTLSHQAALEWGRRELRAWVVGGQDHAAVVACEERRTE